jgi:ribulose-phosphate 3-epimerase
MNFSKSYILCLDIGSYGVCGLVTRVLNGKMEQSYAHFVKNPDTAFALKSVIDELEQKIGQHLTSAYITGNFGEMDFQLSTKVKQFGVPHQITEYDLKQEINKIQIKDGFYKMHVIPVLFRTPTKQHITTTPVNQVDTELHSVFSVISYPEDRTVKINEILRSAHIQPLGFFDPCFLQGQLYLPKNGNTLFLDFGAEFTTVSLWFQNGPLFIKKIPFGQNNITKELAEKINISEKDADDLKISISNTVPNENDRFHPATETGRFASIQKSDINDVFQPKILELVNLIKQESSRYLDRYKPNKIILSGGGASIRNINSFLEKHFGIPVENHGEMASLNALLNYIWDANSIDRENFIKKQNAFNNRLNKFLKLFKRKKIKTKHKLIPIMPSTLCFDMNDNSTYTMFASAGLSMIHVDIMDGLYVDRMAGGIDELEKIRMKTGMHLHTHLMVQTPAIVAADAINAGADTIIIPADTPGTENAIKIIKKAGKRCGIALNPDIPATFIKDMLSMVDEVMVMAVKPGAAGQKFDEGVIEKIKSLDYTRKKHGLKYLISVDGGINPETAKLCWNAGANLLESDSYLENAPDFRLAIISLLKH